VHALDFPSGKIWAAEQLEEIGRKYFNRDAKILAQIIRDTVVEGDNIMVVHPAAVAPPSGDLRFVVPEHSWDPSRQALDRDLRQAFLQEEEKNRGSGARSAPVGESLSLFQVPGWNTR
jgi:hypothetical protein